LTGIGQAEIDTANAEIEASQVFAGQVLDAGLYSKYKKQLF